MAVYTYRKKNCTFFPVLVGMRTKEKQPKEAKKKYTHRAAAHKKKEEKKLYIEWERASGKMKMLKQIYYDIKELNC